MPGLGFGDLPPELRDLVWEFTLPKRQIFHVKAILEQKSTNSTKREMYFQFHVSHLPPTTTRICRESRKVALRRGFLLSRRADHAGYWFNPEIDILYFDRNQRTSFHVKPNQPRMTVSGWDRVLNVGLEWRAFFRDTPHPLRNETMADYWRAAIAPLYAYMPRMQTVNYILPMVRHKGGVTWGREPYGVQQFDVDLITLPQSTCIPWETTRNRGGGMEQPGLGLWSVRSPSVVTWGQVKEDIERSFVEYETKVEEVEVGRMKHSPVIRGWWLLRSEAPTSYENPLIMRFDR